MGYWLSAIRYEHMASSALLARRDVHVIAHVGTDIPIVAFDVGQGRSRPYTESRRFGRVDRIIVDQDHSGFLLFDRGDCFCVKRRRPRGIIDVKIIKVAAAISHEIDGWRIWIADHPIVLGRILGHGLI